MRTLTQLLAIAGLGLILGAAHAIVRGEPGVTLRDIAPGPARATDPPTPNGIRSGEPDSGGANPSQAVDGPPSEQTAEPGPDPSPGSASGPGADPAPVSADPLDAPVHPGQITLREAFELFEQGAWFLDARNESDFSKGHIEGAIWMPASRASSNDGQDDLNFIPPGEVVVIYCTGGDCDASKNTQRRLALLQYDFDVRILGKGYIDWIEADLPVSLPEDAGGDEP